MNCIVRVVFVGIVATALQLFAAAEAWKVGEQIEAKWGMKWYKATIQKVEGGRFHVKYEDGFQEWITPDRIRAMAGAGGPGAAGAANGGNPAKPPAGGAAADRPIAVGDTIEVKTGPKWWKATVLKKEADKVFVKYDGADDSSNEWITLDRVRRAAVPAAGGTTDAPPAAAAEHGGAKQITLKDAQPSNDYQPTPAPEPKALAPVSVVLPHPPTSFFDKPEAILVAPLANVAVVAHKDGTPGKPGSTRLERVSLGGGAAPSQVSIPTRLKAHSISPDGKLVACVPEDWTKGENVRVEVWSVEGAGKQVASFKPFPSTDKFSQAVDGAILLDTDRLLTQNNHSGKLVLWDLKATKAIYVLNEVGHGAPVFSHDRKYFVIGPRTGNGAIVEATTGKVVLSIARTGDSVAFSPDGKFLVSYASNRLVVTDLMAGKVVQDLGSTAPPARGAMRATIAWPAGSYVLLPGNVLFDLNRQGAAWQFTTPPVAHTAVAAGRLYTVATNRTGRNVTHKLIGAPLVTPQVIAASAKIDPKAQVAVGPGASVGIEVNVEGDEAFQNKVKQALTDQVKAMGGKIDNNAPIKIAATTEPGEGKEVKYRMFGPGGGEVSTTVTSLKMKVEARNGEQSLWSIQSATGAPFGVMLKQGQTIDDYIASYQLQQKNWLTQPHLPPTLLKPEAMQAQGTTKLE